MRSVLRTPTTAVEVVEHEGRVESIHFRRGARATGPKGPVAERVDRYLRGEPEDFGDLDVNLSGFSPFEQRVLRAAQRIPPGRVQTYGDLAAAVGEPGAARAVGNALGKNTACIVVPCHRVVSASGLGGFSGGLGTKRFLLELEGVDPAALHDRLVRWR